MWVRQSMPDGSWFADCDSFASSIAAVHSSSFSIRPREKQASWYFLGPACTVPLCV
jgi:hypothetical protein